MPWCEGTNLSMLDSVRSCSVYVSLTTGSLYDQFKDPSRDVSYACTSISMYMYTSVYDIVYTVRIHVLDCKRSCELVLG